jgi:hypothetical protein
MDESPRRIPKSLDSVYKFAMRIGKIRKISRSRAGFLGDLPRLRRNVDALLKQNGFDLAPPLGDLLSPAGLRALSGLLDGEDPALIARGGQRTPGP